MTFRERRGRSAQRTHAFRALILVLAAAGLLWTGCGEQQPARDAQVEELRLIREADGTQVVHGFLVNPSERSIGAAQIMVDLYDGDVNNGARPAESMRLEVRSVEPGERKAFRQVVDSGLRLTGARVRNILLM
jgi:hypothetical protein